MSGRTAKLRRKTGLERRGGRVELDARRRRQEAIRQPDALYAQLPPLECKGLCHDTCTSVDASELERERMREARPGVELPTFEEGREAFRRGEIPRCPMLGPLNTCTVYDVRPLICRAFGMVYDSDLLNPAHTQPMMCDHGCIPDGTITRAQLFRHLRQIEALSQEVTGVSRIPPGGFTA